MGHRRDSISYQLGISRTDCEHTSCCNAPWNDRTVSQATIGAGNKLYTRRTPRTHLFGVSNGLLLCPIVIEAPSAKMMDFVMVRERLVLTELLGFSKTRRLAWMSSSLGSSDNAAVLWLGVTVLIRKMFVLWRWAAIWKLHCVSP